MAEDAKTTQSIEVGMGSNIGGTTELDGMGNQKVSPKAQSGSVDVGTEQTPVHTADNVVDKGADDGTGRNKPGEEGKVGDDVDKGEQDKAAEKAADALPEFKADDEAVVKQYDQRFVKDGTLNMEEFSKEWWGNAEGGDTAKGGLNDGTYAYLQNEFGLTKDQVKEFEAGQIALQQQHYGNMAKAAGGEDQLAQMLDWGRKGGYTNEQKAAFNAAYHGQDRAKAQEAVELLMARYEKATKSSASPQRRSTENAGGAGGADGPSGNVFNSKDEWLAARKEAGRDTDKQQAVQAKFMRSPGAKQW